jgi:hypothetical protein
MAKGPVFDGAYTWRLDHTVQVVTMDGPEMNRFRAMLDLPLCHACEKRVLGWRRILLFWRWWHWRKCRWRLNDFLLTMMKKDKI